jgi:O-antigen/teichoic acid export membrane protein
VKPVCLRTVDVEDELVRRATLSDGVPMSEGEELFGIVVPSSPDAISRGVVHGGAWLGAGQVVTLAASMVATPIVIRRLGPTGYGLLSLVNILIGYLAAADLGMVEASSKFGAERLAAGDDDGEAQVVWTSLALAGAAAGALSIALAIGAPFIVDNVLSLPARLSGVGILALRLGAIGFFARALSGVLNTSQIVRMRWDLNVLVTSGFATVQVVAVPLVLVAGGGLTVAVGVCSALAIATALTHYVVSVRLQPSTWPPRFSSALAGPLIRFGVATMGGYTLFVLLLNLDRAFIARYQSVEEVGFYTVAASLAGLMNVVTFAVSRPLLPAFARLLAEERRSEAVLLYQRILRLLFLLAVPVVVSIATVGHAFLDVWAGPSFGTHASTALALLVVGVAFDALGYVPSNLLYASHRAGAVLVIHLVEFVPYVAALLFVVPRWGIEGAAAVWIARSAVNSAMYVMAVRGKTGMPVPLSGDLLARAAVAGTAFVPLVFLSRLDLPLAPLAAMGVLSVSVYGLLAYRFGLAPEDRVWIRSLIGRS